MTEDEASYEAGARCTLDVVGAFKGRGPLFAFPPREYALLADLGDMGPKLARNDAAHTLLFVLTLECTRRKLDSTPTCMMLRYALDHHGIPWLEVPLKELGLNVAGLSRGRVAKA